MQFVTSQKDGKYTLKKVVPFNNIGVVKSFPHGVHPYRVMLKVTSGDKKKPKTTYFPFEEVKEEHLGVAEKWFKQMVKRFPLDLLRTDDGYKKNSSKFYFSSTVA